MKLTCIGVIGGQDGPTAVLTAVTVPPAALLLPLLPVLAGLRLFLRMRKNKEAL